MDWVGRLIETDFALPNTTAMAPAHPPRPPDDEERIRRTERGGLEVVGEVLIRSWRLILPS